MCYMSVIDPEVKHNILIQKTRVIIPSKFGKLLFKNNIDKFTKCKFYATSIVDEKQVSQRLVMQ